jgi:murein DD-endopeptidase MepM/ murein hydrolase activator NlpD/muramidase (phage lysozyme)
MFLRSPFCKIQIADKFFYETGDGYLQQCNVSIAEQERSSSCSFSFYDPGLKVLNLLLTEFQSKGGIMIPANLLENPQSEATSSTASGATLLGVDYLKNIEKRFGCGSDLSKLTSTGKRCLEALKSVNVQAFLKAIAIAELGEDAEAKGGYGYLFGDTGGKETFSPCSLSSHPKRRISSGRFTSSATGRYQTMDFVWEDDAYGYRKLGLVDFKPVSQEILAVGRMIYRQILDDVIAGRFEAAIDGKGKGLGARYEWASIQGNPYGQGTPGGKRTTFLANIQKFIQSASKTPAATSATSPATPTTATPTTTPTIAPATTPTAIAPTVDVKEGIIINIELGFYDKASESGTYQFLLTDVRGSNDYPNTTRIMGKQITYAIAKSAKLSANSKIYKIRQNTTVRQIAQEFVKKTGGDLGEFGPAANNIIASSLQSESDYEYLLKVAKSQGLFIRGEATKLNIKELKPDDKTIIVKAIALRPGATWGDRASSDRVLASKSPDSIKPPFVVPTPTNPSGILDLKLKPGDEIGKGFESSISINTMMMPEILLAQPGQILKLDDDVNLGNAIAQAYRISEVSHSYNDNAIATSINLYLPVKIKAKQVATPAATGSAPSVGSTLFVPANLQASPKRGDKIAGYTVSSPFGPRASPGGIGSTNHQGTDVPMPVGTPLYPIVKPGETVDVKYVPNSGAGGNIVEFTYGGFIWQYMHLSSGFSGKAKAGDVIARSGNTGASTGPHLHFAQRKLDRTAIPPQAGFVYWAIAGKQPT